MEITTNRIKLVKESVNHYASKQPITSPSSLYGILVDVFDLDMESVEHMMVVAVDTKHNVLSTTISIGTVNSSLVSTREIFQWLLLNNAVKFAVAHNHPTGNSQPSPEDVIVTNKLKDAGNLMGVTLLDHIIVGHGNYTSLKESGYIL